MNEYERWKINIFVIFKYEALNGGMKHKEVMTMIKKWGGKHVHEISEPIFQS